MVWVDRNQLGRRNLTDEQRAVVIGRLYKTAKLAPHRPKQDEKVVKLTTFSGHAATAKTVASQIGVGEKTVRRAAKFTEAVEALEQVSPEAAQVVLRGEVKDALTMLPKVPQEALEFVAQRIVEGERSIKKAKIEWYLQQREQRLKERAEVSTQLEQPFVLHCCDIREAHKFVEANSIDLIITDPPYGREYLHLYEALSEFAAHALKEGGVCLVMTGQSYLPEVLPLLTKHLDYVWMLAYYMQPPAPFIVSRNIANNWKPIIYLAKGKPDVGQINDVVVSKEPDKREHEWQQNLEAFAELVKRFARPKMVVCDPFCGTGTTGVAALLNNCQFIGLDVDSEVLEKARRRLEAVGGGNDGA